MTKSAALTFAGFLVASQCFADRAMPSDVELRSAYCTSIVLGRLEIVRDLERTVANDPDIPAELRTKTSAEMRKLVTEEESRKARLNAYLLPKLNYLDPTALQAALARGKIDQGEAAAARRSCGDSCRTKDYLSCMTECGNRSDVIRRVQVCDNLDWLPF